LRATKLVNFFEAEYGPRMKRVAAFAVLGILLQACCSCPQSAESPNGAEAPPVADVDAPAPVAAEPTPAPTPEPAPAPPKEEPKPAKPAVAEPAFTDGMSVADAIKAVPQGAERANIDQETLSIPIQNPDVYEPCKPGPVRIKLKIAVWDGKAVGLDVTATPKNDKVAACVREQILKLSWKAKVKSLNIVEYSF
jgi:hypothetical protein